MPYRILLSMSCLLISVSAWAINPYLYGDPLAAGNVHAVAASAEKRLEAEGFKVVGKYFPKHYPGHGIVIATDEAMLKEIAEAGKQTIASAAIRVGVKADGTVSYTNPDYWYRATFRNRFPSVENTVDGMQKRLSRALGAGQGFGGDESAKSLSNYRYMVGMERLDSSKNRLTELESFNDAVKTVRDNLSRKIADTAKVYEVIIPGKQLAVFGVAFTDEENGDASWLKTINAPESFAGLPYEIFVVGNEVHALHARYRIALSFPDTGMGTFMRISNIPNMIRDTLLQVAGGKVEEFNHLE